MLYVKPHYGYMWNCAPCASTTRDWLVTVKKEKRRAQLTWKQADDLSVHASRFVDARRAL